MIDFIKKVSQDIRRVIVSDPKNHALVKKVTFTKLEIKKQHILQKTTFIDKKAFHENFSFEQGILEIERLIHLGYRQVLVETSQDKIQLFQKGSQLKVVKEENKKPLPFVHNREKNHFYTEGKKVDFLIDLGIMTKEGKIVSKMQAKFRQINQFIELIKPVILDIQAKQNHISLVDVGCGKGYLTFALYDFLKELKFEKIVFHGLDLKTDVIEKNQKIAHHYQFDGLEFLHCDIKNFHPKTAVDVVVALHACDIATDIAIQNAIRWQAQAIFLAPCCHQHHLKEIQNPVLDGVMQFGIFKERLNAIITDAIRANYLETQGYKVVVAEFVDREDSLKNILIKAVYNGFKADKSQKNYDQLKDFFNIKPVLE